MQCATVKKGTECSMMNPKGCSFKGGKCGEIVPQCEGCNYVVTCADKKYCKSYPDPAAKWMFGSCNLATHIQRKLTTETKKVNPLKASKKAMAGKG
jgi:hypothetical protein